MSAGSRPRLRTAGPADYDAIRSVYRAAVRGLATGHYAPEQIEAWCRWLDRDAFERRLAEGQIHVLAEIDGEPRGYGGLDPEAHRVRAVYVHPEAARTGLGAALLEALERHAREAGIASLHLESSLNAVPFYRAMGWSEKEAGRHATLHGMELECVLMEKRLD